MDVTFLVVSDMIWFFIHNLTTPKGNIIMIFCFEHFTENVSSEQGNTRRVSRFQEDLNRSFQAGVFMYF